MNREDDPRGCLGRGATRVLRSHPLFTVTDQTIGTAGKVALWSKADSVTRFDALTI